LYRPNWIPLGLFLSIAVLAGCKSLGELITDDKRASSFDATTKAYFSSLRWGYFDVAEGFIATRDEAPDPPDKDFLENIRVTRYEVKFEKPTSDPNEVVLIVAISYYHTHYGRVKTLKDEQAWWYSEEENSWFLDGNLPDFKGGMMKTRR